MMASRSGSLRLPHRAISWSVLPQPMHKPVWPLTAQTLMQGVEGAGSLMGGIRRTVTPLCISKNDNFR
jgi:hypothetical protein